MTITKPLLRQLADPTFGHDDRARLRCQIAAELEQEGNYEAAREALAELWQGVGEQPALAGLSDLTAAEVLMRAGALTGWFGSAEQLAGAQAAAKDLISASITRFLALGAVVRVAAARSELGLCYRRAGAYDEARVMYHEALKGLADGREPELEASILLRLALVESCSGRYHDALRILTDAAPLFEKSAHDAQKGKFHNELACVLRALGQAEGRPDYTDRAIIEYTAASYHFEQAEHLSYHARAENNLGFLYYTIGRYNDAHEHLDHARRLACSLKDGSTTGHVDETRARVLLAEGRTTEANEAIRAAVATFTRCGEQGQLAEALITQGLVLARSGARRQSLATFGEAANLAEQAGAVEEAGLALVTLIEEYGEQLPSGELAETYRRADELLARTQDFATIARLRACARLVLAKTPVIERERRGLLRLRLTGRGTLADPWADFSLVEEVRAYEAKFVQRALIEAEGRLTRAARLLGLEHQVLSYLLCTRHKDLAGLRRPPVPRKQSVFRIRSRRHISRFARRKATRPITILHVEDNKLVADTVRDALEFEGWRVETMSDGPAALNKISSRTHYDLLLLDNELPGIHGLELLRRARALSHRQHTPIIMFSAAAARAEGMNAGADVFLQKPDDINSVTEKVRQLLTERQVLKTAPSAAPPVVEIETARLRLRRFEPSDLGALSRLLGDPEVMRYLGQDAGRRTLSQQETEAALTAFIGDWQRYGFSRFAVLDKETEQLIGLCGWKQLAGTPELLYVFDKTHWGQGLTAEAARACLRYGFEELGLERIVAITRPEHGASRRVLEKIGLRYEQATRHYDVDLVQYAITRTEFRSDAVALYVLHHR